MDCLEHDFEDDATLEHQAHNEENSTEIAEEERDDFRAEHEIANKPEKDEAHSDSEGKPRHVGSAGKVGPLEFEERGAHGKEHEDRKESESIHPRQRGDVGLEDEKQRGGDEKEANYDPVCARSMSKAQERTHKKEMQACGTDVERRR